MRLSLLPILVVGITATPTETRLSCHEISIPVRVPVESADIPRTAGIDNVNGTYSLNQGRDGVHIRARYCEPTKKVAGRRDTLQVLVHGITYTRDYWSGLAAPGTKPGQDQYSWVKFAAEQGYPTLSIDRLCNGESSHPNGRVFCQLPFEAETIHAIIEMARKGRLPKPCRPFKKFIYVGHSYGSLIGNGLAIQHPDDVDAYILTGFSQQVAQGMVGASTLPMFAPAALVAPGKYGSLDYSYLQATNKTGTQIIFYRGKYSNRILDYDFENRGTVTLGEAITGALGQFPAPSFKGAVFVLNGNEDAIFCQDSIEHGLAGFAGNCSNGFSSSVGLSYPAARKFDFYNTANTGHCLNTHDTAQESFQQAHKFLAGAGF